MSRGKPDELLAVWAQAPEDLDADERAEVLALLARDPAMRVEAEAMRRLLLDARALPEPEMPVSLAREIADAIDREAASPWARLRAWILRPAVGLGVAAATAGVLGLWITTHRGATIDEMTTAVPGTSLDAQAVAPIPLAPVEMFRGAPATSGELADLEGLDDRALDRLDQNLGGELDDEATAVPTDDGLLPNPDLDWVDDLSSADVDSLDKYLEQHRSPT